MRAGFPHSDGGARFSFGQGKWRAFLPTFCLVLTIAGWVTAWAQAPVESLLIQGKVRSGNSAIPGATVTAVNGRTGEKSVTWTGLDGSYALPVAGEGNYTIQAEMTGFAPVTHEVTVNSPITQADLVLVLQARAEQAAGVHSRQPATGPGNRGFQSLALMQAVAGNEPTNGTAGDQVVPAGMPVPGIAPDVATESIAVSGSTNSGMLTMSSDELQQRMREYREQQDGFRGGPGGGFGGGPGGGFGGGPPGGGPRGGGGPMVMLGGRGRFDINRPHGMIYYSAGDSALNAAPYSLTGVRSLKPGYLQQRFGASMGGPLNIPKIYKGGAKTFFFANYNGSRSDNPYDAFSTVPTVLERGGDFSQTTVANGPNAGARVQIFDPITHLPFVGNKVPTINPAASGLLKFIPLPNLPGEEQNFHYGTSATNNLDDLNVRLIRALGNSSVGPRRGRGPQNNLTFGLHYHSTRTTLTNPFPSVGGNTSVRSFDIPVGYIRSVGKLTNIFRVDYNRNRISTRNLYAFAQNIAGDLGITGVSSNPFDWGLPNLSFTDVAGLQDTNPLLRRDQTWTFSDSMVWNHRKHTWRWGGDFRRIQLNTETDSNARGSFVFTGLNTAQVVGGSPVSGTGFDFADFLLGLPQQTSVQFGQNSYHFRGDSWDLFVQDEWKVRGNLTLNLGLRYEYVSPLSEVNNRIVNLDVAPGFMAAKPVLPGQTGPVTGLAYPSTLMNPDRNNFAPRVGFAWKALPKTVVRAGYGINYNTAAYSSIVQQLGFQPPFSITQTNVQIATGELTLQNGFPSQPNTVTNNYGVDPNYRLGYVQIWNADVQQEILPTLIMNLDYTGTKGTRLDIVEAPNRNATGLRIQGVQPFLWEDSVGDSTAHAGTVRVRKRLQHGLSLGGTYTFSKSIDNASSIGNGSGASGAGSNGAGSTLVAQNAFDLAAERGLSSFDQRHKFTADYLWELPFGHDRFWLTGSGVLRDIFGDWQWSGDWTIATGLPFTPRVLGNFADVNRGTNGTLRADVTGAPVALSNPSISEWFNTAAFVVPPPGQFGNARRNSIEGPGTRLFDMGFTKVIPLKESRTLELRAQFSNIFNTPQFMSIDTVVNSPTYGRVIAVGVMRTVQFTARFRF